jgi:hypothetical protein
LSQKSPDLSAIPCAQGTVPKDDLYHDLGPRNFAEVHQLNILTIVARLSAKPLIRVEADTFVGRYEIRNISWDPLGGGGGDSQDERTPAGDPGEVA